MRVERPRRPALRHAIGLVPLLALLAVPARADGLYGTLQLQYQKSDQVLMLQSGDNLIFARGAPQELWLRTLDVHHQSYVRPDLLLESNVRYSDQTILGREDVTRTPYGSLRLIHPWFQVVASLQPTTQRSSLSSQSGLNADSVTTRQVTTHNRETLLNGHVGVPRWPALDFTWINRRRDGAGSSSDQNRTRSLRLTFDRDRASVYSGVTDQRVTSATAGAGTNTQQIWSAGTALRYMPTKTTNVNAQYDLSDVLGEAAGVQRAATFSQSLMLGAEWRPTRKFVASTGYQWRRVSFGTAVNPPQVDHEGSLLGRWQFSPHANVVGGGGIRTVRTALPDGTSREDLQRYVTAIAALNANVRRNWQLNAGASHTTNWDPMVRRYSVETVSATSQAPLAKHIRVDGSVQVAANLDSAIVAQRYSNSWNLRLQATPLRALVIGVSRRSLRVGPSLLKPAATSRGMLLDVNWRPAPVMQVIGQYGSNSEQPGGTSRNSTRSLSARLEPSRRWQWYVSWTRTDQTTIVSSAGQLSSREAVMSRVQFSPSRRLSSSASLSFNDPGRAQELRRTDLAFTWSFGR